jgi:DNA-binding GntR family transcriptional regulator
VYYAQSERYRLLGLAFRHLQKRRRDGVTEHRVIMEHALARDASAACKQLAGHLAHTIDEVEFALREMKVPEGNPPARRPQVAKAPLDAAAD